MKRYLIVTSLVLLASIPAVAQSKQGAKSKVDTKTFTMLSSVARQTMQFSLSRDTKMFNTMVADDFITTDSTGRVFDKAEEMEILRSSDFKLDSLQMDDFNIRMFGDTAVVTSRSNVKGSYKGQDISGQYQVTQVFQRRPGARATATNAWAMITCLNVRMSDAVSNSAR